MPTLAILSKGEGGGGTTIPGRIVNSLQMNRLIWEITSWSSRLTDHFWWIHRTYAKWIEQYRKMSTCKQLDLESLGSWLTMPKNFPCTKGNNCPQGQGGRLWVRRGLVLGSKGVSTWDARGRLWDHGGHHVGLWSSLGLVPNYVVLVLSIEGGGPQHMQGRHIRGLGIGLRKLVVLTLNTHQIFNWC
jgi:hypothetical protein